MASDPKPSDGDEIIDPMWPKQIPHGVPPAWAWLQEMAHRSPPTSDQDFEGFILALICKDIEIDQIQPGRLVCSLPVKPRLLNRYWTLHGGVSATLINVIGLTAIKTLAGAREATVTDISISYITAMPVYEEVELEAKVLRMGKSNAVASVEARNKLSRQITAQGRVTVFFDGISKL